MNINLEIETLHTLGGSSGAGEGRVQGSGKRTHVLLCCIIRYRFMVVQKKTRDSVQSGVVVGTWTVTSLPRSMSP